MTRQIPSFRFATAGVAVLALGLSASALVAQDTGAQDTGAQDTGAQDSGAQDSGRFTREPNLDRSGSDLRRDVLGANDPIEVCEARCRAATGCVAFTYVKKSTTVPEPICWLKKVVPVGYPSECCISGVLKP